MKGSQKKKIFWMIFSLALALLTIWAVLKQSEDMSIKKLLTIIEGADKKWIIVSMISAALFVFFEAVAICSILKEISYKKSIGKGILYSTSDIYFSAITPSATGGQPASAFFMLRDGIPVGVASATLVVNLMMYTAAIIFLGLIAVIVSPKLFFEFNFWSRVFIGAGAIGLTVLVIFFLAVLRRGEKVFTTLANLLRFLHKKKIIHKLDGRLLRLNKIQIDYENCSSLIAGKSSIMFKAFFWNVIQRSCQIVVPSMVYIALGGQRHQSVLLFFKQCLITIGYNFVPIPGAMGIADYLMIDGFSSFMTKNAAFELDMISRGITFYICVTISGLITLIGYMKGKKRYDRSL